MLVLVRFRKKRPWETNKTKPTFSGSPVAMSQLHRVKSPGPHPGGTCLVSMLEPLCRMVPVPELLGPCRVQGSELKLAAISGQAKWMD